MHRRTGTGVFVRASWCARFMVELGVGELVAMLRRGRQHHARLVEAKLQPRVPRLISELGPLHGLPIFVVDP